MHLNASLFRQNGGCGYVLKPRCLRDSTTFNPYQPATFAEFARPKRLTLLVLSARHLVKATKGIASPFVDIELVGVEADAIRVKTKTQSAWRMRRSVARRTPAHHGRHSAPAARRRQATTATVPCGTSALSLPFRCRIWRFCG